MMSACRHVLTSIAIGIATACLALSGCATPGAPSANANVANLPSEQVEAIKQDVATLIQQFEDDLNSKDPNLLGRGLHSPNYRLFNGELQVIEGGSLDLAQQTLAYLASTGWDRTEYGALNFIHLSADKVHVDTPFTRYRADGSEIGRWRSIYIFTREEGVWGLKFRSSFANLDK